MNHSQAVEKHYLMAEHGVEHGVYDDAFRNITYYENQKAPVGPRPDDKGRQKGEFDVLLVNYDRKIAYYKEVKTGRKDLGYGQDQVERAVDHFEDYGWDVYGSVVLEDGETDW